MSKLIFSNKRDSNGTLLHYSRIGHAYEIAEKCLSVIENYETYKILINYLPKKYIDIYFKKLFYEASLPLSGQIIINDWHLKNEGNYLSKSINAVNFPSIELLNLVYPTSNFEFIINNNFKMLKNKMKNSAWPYYNGYLRYKNFFNKNLYFIKKNYENISLSKNPTIAVNYIEGYDLNNRSDLFWLKNSGIDPTTVLIYFDHKKRMNRFSNENDLLTSLKSQGIRWVKLWKWSGIKNIDFIDALFDDLNKFNTKDLIDRWLLKSSKILVSKIEFWYSFFKDFNIKIHINSEEHGLGNVVRQIAITKLQGCSVGKLRSYPTQLKGNWFSLYPNNIFFTWGKDSLKRMKLTDNGFDNIIISGFPYSDSTKEKKKEVADIKHSFQKSGVKFVLMLIDTVHHSNKDYNSQTTDSLEMNKFYKFFFDWFNEDKEIGIIIKSKFPQVLKTLPEIQKIVNNAVKTGRCYLDDVFGSNSRHYAPIVDFSISAASDFPTALIENIISGTRGIFYDYADFRHLEKNIYEWGKNKVFFLNLNEIINDLKIYKKDPKIKKELGDWSREIEDYDPYRDGKGGERIGSYINWLQCGFKEGLDQKKTLNYANEKYIHKYGRDKIEFFDK